MYENFNVKTFFKFIYILINFKFNQNFILPYYLLDYLFHFNL